MSRSVPRILEPDYKRVLGQFCTGVTVIAAIHEGEAIGFTCQTFGALSLDPPLVHFAPQRTSSSWPRLRASGTYVASILAAEHAGLARQFARSGTDKFRGVRYGTSPMGHPVIEGSLAWVECRLEDELDAGDHTIVISRVTAMAELESAEPLIFHRGRLRAHGAPAE